MKVLAISGSPRKKGNTSFLLQQALQELETHGIETELIHLSDYRFSDCIGCEGCRESFRCVIKDDMQKIYPLINQADALILGSPTYFYDVTSIMKAFLDRLYCFEVFDESDRSVWMSVNEANGGKLASVISVCEQSRAEDTGYAAKTMELTLQALGYRVVERLEALNLFHKGCATEDNSAIEGAQAIAKKLAMTMLLKQKILSNSVV